MLAYPDLSSRGRDQHYTSPYHHDTFICEASESNVRNGELYKTKKGLREKVFLSSHWDPLAKASGGRPYRATWPYRPAPSPRPAIAPSASKLPYPHPTCWYGILRLCSQLQHWYLVQSLRPFSNEWHYIARIPICFLFPLFLVLKTVIMHVIRFLFSWGWLYLELLYLESRRLFLIDRHSALTHHE